MNQLIQKLVNPTQSTFGDGAALAAELQALGYQHVLLPMALYTQPGTEDTVNELLNGRYRNAEAMRKLCQRGEIIALPPTPPPAIRQVLNQCLDRGTALPVWPWHTLAEPDSELAKRFALPGDPTWDAEKALAYWLHSHALHAGLVAHWQGTVQVIPWFTGDPFLNLEDAWAYLSSNIGAIPHELTVAPNALLNVAEALHRLGLATDLLLRSGLAGGVRKYHGGMDTALVTTPAGFLGDRYSRNLLEFASLKLDNRSDPLPPSPSRRQWHQLVAECAENGRLRAINRMHPSLLHLQVSMLARFAVRVPRVADIEQMADQLLARGETTVGAAWDAVCELLSKLRLQRPDDPAKQQAFGEQASKTIRNAITAQLR